MSVGVDRLIGHKEWAPTRKSDPKYDMNWRRGCVAAFVGKVEDRANWVQGAIKQRWIDMGAENSVLGWPVTQREQTCPDGVGRYSHFERGSIYWTPDLGPKAIYGGIRAAWAGLGWERSSLGYPTNEEHDDPERENGRRQDFQRGILTWTREGGVWIHYRVA